MMKTVVRVLAALLLGAVSAQADPTDVKRCWNVDVEQPFVDVTVRFEIDQTGRLIPDSIELVGVAADHGLLDEDGFDPSVNTAFQSARRAILRCSSTKDFPFVQSGRNFMEIEFSPRKMRMQ
ncbi:hypothetical protein O4H61_19475 [Roseovarius aestuarii]|nr:hypothetical protein [Roseovarius aestuarii]